MATYEPPKSWFLYLQYKVDLYRLAKDEKRYAESDALRAELTGHGVIDLDSNPKWHPVFESVASRMERLNG